MSKKLIYLAPMVNVSNLEVCKTYSIRSARKVSLFRDFVLAVFLSVVCSLLTATPAAYAVGGYALEVGGGRTVTINDDKDVLRLGSYTYELWMKDLDGPTGSWRNVFYKGSTNSSAGRGPLLALRPSENGVHFDHSTGTGQSTLDTHEGIPVNEWTHIALVLTSLTGEQIIYQDGVEVAVRTSAGLTDATQWPAPQ
ncbi:MAG: LamG-like jellyroll fold domain-containing protein [Planctomycetota bacterium]